jgi:hypothetical protein
MSHFNFCAALGLTLLILPGAKADPVFYDSFESADMSATNAFGFSWARNNWTAIVTSEAAVYANGEIYVEASEISGDSADWDPINDQHAMLFEYPAGHNMTEQRFSLGQALPEIWYSYWIKVPENFQHPVTVPNNNKFFATWMDGYSHSGDGPTVFWNIFSNNKGGSDLAISYSDGNYTVAGRQLQHTPFIKVPDDRGRWMKVVMYLKAGNQSGSGEVGFWRRWENENSFTKLHELTNIDLVIPAGGPEGWAKGYIMGWANAPYQEKTDWLLDSFTVSETPLLTVQLGSEPNPPELYIE